MKDLKNKSFIIFDLDGVLVESSAELFKPYWGTTDAIKENPKLKATEIISLVAKKWRESKK